MTADVLAKIGLGFFVAPAEDTELEDKPPGPLGRFWMWFTQLHHPTKVGAAAVLGPVSGLRMQQQ